MKRKIFEIFAAGLAAFAPLSAPAQGADDAFPLPDILTTPISKTKISTAQDWKNIARPEILQFFAENVYGKIPPRPQSIKFELVESSDDALDGLAKRRQYKVASVDAHGSHEFIVLLYLPKSAAGKVPAFVCPNFWGNYSISDEPQVIMARRYIKSARMRIITDADRGCRPERIPVRDIVSRGYAIATFCYCDVYPDYVSRDGALDSVFSIFPDGGEKLAIAAWAWGDIRTRDLLETLPEIDQRRVALAGHSRLAKTAVYAAANDERFALACINNGGGKRLCYLPNLRFKYWFSQKLRKYVENEATGVSVAELRKLCAGKPPLPVEQYALIACIAPRALYLGASDGDLTAPPEVHFPAVKSVETVYRLFGAKSFPPEGMMFSPKPFHGDTAYHCKKGPHSITREDWKNYMDYADKLGWRK